MKSEIRVVTPITTKSQDDGLIITGIASTTNKDLHDEIITKSCLDSMNNQVVGLNLHLDHNHSYDGVIGVITDSKITNDNELYITANILPEFAKDIREKLEFGLSMGLSIGGIIKRNRNNSNIIDDITLLEVSLTPLPANNDSQGSVRILKGVIISNCFGKACHEYLKSLETKNMVKKEEKIEESIEEKAIEEKAIEEKPKEESSEFSKEDAIALFNELMAEKEEVIIEELSQKMENKIQSIVNSILEQSEPKENEEEVVEDEPKENESKEEEETGEVAKALPNLEETVRNSKLDNIMIEKSNNNTFLNSEHRDIFGRNKKYL